jgi:hypothetical protein
MYNFENLDRIIENMNTNKIEPSVVEFYTVNRMTESQKANFGPNDKRFDTDWTVGRRELRYRVSSVQNTGGVETFIYAVNFDENGEEEPTDAVIPPASEKPAYDSVQTMYMYRDDLSEHKKILEEWVRDVCEGTPAGYRHVFDF